MNQVIEQHYSDLFSQLNGKGVLQASGIAHRQGAFDHFIRTGFPTTKNEEWRFTNVQRIADQPFSPATLADATIDESIIDRWSFGASVRLVFVNGFFSGSLSKGIVSGKKGILAGSRCDSSILALSAVKEHLAQVPSGYEHGFQSQNAAFHQDGFVVYVEPRTIIEEPIAIMFISDTRVAGMTTPRNLVIVGDGSQVTLVESFIALNSGMYLTNSHTEVFAGDHAVIEYDRLQIEANEAFHISEVRVAQKAGSRFYSNHISLGGAIVRNAVTSTLAGEGAECTLNGLSIANGSQHIDNHTTIDHAVPNCQSHEIYKAILDGSSRGVFNGKIFVRKDAQKTDAKQTNKTLLLSDDATIDTKPQLEIFADDVKCTHGATVGQLDENQVFYLRSRGISERDARDILTFAFANDVAERVSVPGLKAMLESLVHEKLSQGR